MSTNLQGKSLILHPWPTEKGDKVISTRFRSFDPIYSLPLWASLLVTSVLEYWAQTSSGNRSFDPLYTRCLREQVCSWGLIWPTRLTVVMSREHRLHVDCSQSEPSKYKAPQTDFTTKHELNLQRISLHVPGYNFPMISTVTMLKQNATRHAHFKFLRRLVAC